MQIPKYIAHKVEQFEAANKRAEELQRDIFKYINEHDTIEGVYNPRIVDDATGYPQGDGCYCDQYLVYEDLYRGIYYYPIKGSDKYIAVDYSMF